ncbi:hypothetical protein CLOM_g9534 [Closterium sp. NIES-68]|nr:hypothetical protein CLOM_g9534 [Closterium sp. NIES-68]GJP65598.1 hypothetical protein CLOP_g22471 [Closterium sp. NIES-67]GJP66741.1 hypothetical protein CLOP_g23650 [Closterium sp. NIES-67]
MLGPDVPHRVGSDSRDDGAFSFFGGASTASTSNATASTGTKEPEASSASLHPFAAFSSAKQVSTANINSNTAPDGTETNATSSTTTAHPFRPPGKSQSAAATSSLASPPMVAPASTPLERSRETDARAASTGGAAGGATVNSATAVAASGAAAAAAGGGARRQPRKKFIPEQGMGQMSWRKASAAAANDIARYRMQHQGAIRMEEVKRHKREDDAWTVVRGRVYNITPYLDFHPGGKAILMKGAGKDCTALFNKHHAWVNAEFLLDQCFLGMLIPDD